MTKNLKIFKGQKTEEVPITNRPKGKQIEATLIGKSIRIKLPLVEARSSGTTAYFGVPKADSITTAAPFKDI